MASYIYDMTGENADFKVTDKRFAIFSSEQVCSFGEPVYAKSLVIRKLVDNSFVELTRDVDWILTASCNDYDAMSDAMLRDPAFTDTLVKSVVIRTFSEVSPENHQISCEYQKLRIPDTAVFDPDGEGPAYSPALMKQLLEDVEFLMNVKDPVNNTLANQLGAVQFLEVDLTGMMAENYVQDEEQEIDVPSGVVYMRPLKGSLYRHDITAKYYQARTRALADLTTNGYFNIYRHGEAGSEYPAALTISQQQKGVFTTPDGGATWVKVKNSRDIVGPVKILLTDTIPVISQADYDNGLQILIQTEVTMTEGTDYRVVYCNLAKTKRSHHTSGVYEFIYFTIPIKGIVKISYHAYGGEVSPLDVGELQDSLMDILRVLQSNGYLTADDVSKLPIIRSIIKRIDTMEVFHRHYLQQDYRIKIPDPRTTINWYSIAFVWDNEWHGIDDGTDDVGQFRIESKELGWVYDFTIRVDLRDSSAKRVLLNTVGSAGIGWDIDQYGQTISDMYPVMLRAIWIDDGKDSGVAIQLGLCYKFVPTTITDDLLIVTNKSGGASLWRLYESNLGYHPAENNQVKMPDNVNTADLNDTVRTHSFTTYLGPENGVLYFAGSIPLSFFGKEQLVIPYRDAVRHEAFQSKTGRIDFYIYDRKTDQIQVASAVIGVSGLHSSGIGSYNDTESGAETMFYLADLCGLKVRLAKNASEQATMFLESYLGTSSYYSERFDLRAIAVHSLGKR